MNANDPMTEAARAAILNAVGFDEGRNARAKIGFVLIPNEQTIEEEMLRYMPPGVGAYFSRAPMPRDITSESLGAVEAVSGRRGGADIAG